MVTKEVEEARKVLRDFGRNNRWQKMTPEQRKEWAMKMVKARQEKKIEQLSPDVQENA